MTRTPPAWIFYTHQYFVMRQQRLQGVFWLSKWVWIMSCGRSLRGEEKDQEGIFFFFWCGEEAGMERAGGEGQRSLFFFLLDRIGNLAQWEETQPKTELWRQAKVRLKLREEEKNWFNMKKIQINFSSSPQIFSPSLRGLIGTHRWHVRRS